MLLVIASPSSAASVLQPRLIPMSRDAAAILGAIGPLMVTHFGIHGLRGVAEGAPEAGYPISGALTAGSQWLPPARPPSLSEVSWWPTSSSCWCS